MATEHLHSIATCQRFQNRWNRSIGGAVILITAALLVGCGTEYSSMASDRAAYAREALGPVLIAVVEDPLGPGFLHGIELAVNEINARDGGLLDRALSVRRFPGSSDFHQAQRIADRIADDPRISVVLGHRRSNVAVPTSIIYERAEVLFLPSFATAEQLTQHGFEFVLRTLPDNSIMAAQTASVVDLFGHQRIAVLHSRDDGARELAFLFEDEARARGIAIAFSTSFFDHETNYRSILGQLNAVQFDAIYLSAGHQAGARLLRQLRELGFEQPVFGSDHLAYGNFNPLVGAAGDRTVVPVVYDVTLSTPKNQAFVESYRTTYGIDPGQAAAQGYDAAWLFANIVRVAGSTEPQVLATTAHYAPPYAGVTGIFAYDSRGNVYGKVFDFRVLRFGRWWSLPGVTTPYRFASFRAARREIAIEKQQQPHPLTGAAEEADTVSVAMQTQGKSAVFPVGAEHQASTSPGAMTAVAPDSEATDALSLKTLTGARLNRAERNRIWLTLAHEILRFKRLGLIIPQSASGSAAVSLARTLGDEIGFSVEVCKLPPRNDPADQSKDSAPNVHEPPHSDHTESSEMGPLKLTGVRCWSALARTVDALLVPPETGLPPELVRRLNHTLRNFGVPSFTLAQSLEDDLGLTLALVASGVNLDNPQVAQRFNGVLKGLKVHTLNRKLTNLPMVSADFQAFAELGIQLDPRLLTLISRTMAQTSPAARPNAPNSAATID